jgi:hypothetical protein
MRSAKFHSKVGLAALSLTALVGGCARMPPIQTVSEGKGVPKGAKLSFAQTERTRTAIEKEIGKQLTTAFARADLTLGDQGQYLIDYSYAKRPPTVGISRLGKEVAWISAPGGNRGLFACKRQTYRLTLLVVEQQSGEIVYHGASEQAACLDAAADEPGKLLNALVSDFGSRSAAPR